MYADGTPIVFDYAVAVPGGHHDDNRHIEEEPIIPDRPIPFELEVEEDECQNDTLGWFNLDEEEVGSLGCLGMHFNEIILLCITTT